MGTVGLPLGARRPMYSAAARSTAWRGSVLWQLVFFPRPGSFGRMSDLSSASGDRVVAADCPSTTNACLGWRKKQREMGEEGQLVSGCGLDGTTEARHQKESDF
jgi:hypothetical protein